MRITTFEGLIYFLESPVLDKAMVCKFLSDAYGVYADPLKDKGEIIKGFAHLWNNYHLKGLEMPLFD